MNMCQYFSYFSGVHQGHDPRPQLQSPDKQIGLHIEYEYVPGNPDHGFGRVIHLTDKMPAQIGIEPPPDNNVNLVVGIQHHFASYPFLGIPSPDRGRGQRR